MSKKPKTTSFNYQADQPLPKIGRIKTEWDLKSLYYQSEKDPLIETDIKKAIAAYHRFAKKYRGAAFTTSVKVLAKALQDLEKIVAMPETSKPGRYFSFRQVLNAKDHVAEKQLALISDRLIKAGNELLFFEIELGKIGKKQQQIFLNAPELAPYRYYLERVFLEAKHDLSEAEEKIINLKSGPSCGMWVQATEKMLSNRTVIWKGKEIGFNEALESLNSLPSKDKPKLWTLLVTEMEKLSEVVEGELNAVVTDKKIEDELRGYQKPYSATVEAYEDNLTSVESLVEAVSTKGFALSKKFYRLKAKFHGLEKLHYAQKYDPIGTPPKILFAEAVEICRDVFYSLKTEYGEVFDRMLRNGQIDVYPRSGKRGGAFMSDAINLPTHVFLNQTDDLNSFRTLAHEMGHAIHGARSKTQPPFYQGHSITTAETASTLFENLVFEKFYQQLSDKQKAIVLHDRIGQNVATIQRQIACFNFELELHETVRTQGAVTREELRAMMERHMKSYTGAAVDVTARDGYIYVYWSHVRYGFYVYTYTFGILMSNLMAQRYHADPSYIKEIDTFLCAGKKDTVANIFKEIGINTNRLDTFLEGLALHEADINAFAQMVKAKHKN